MSEVTGEKKKNYFYVSCTITTLTERDDDRRIIIFEIKAEIRESKSKIEVCDYLNNNIYFLEY